MAGGGWEIVQGLYLVSGLYHIAITYIGYTIALIYVFIYEPRKRIIPLLLIIAITAFNCIFFWTVFSNLSIPDLFNGRRWPSDLFQHWPIVFVIDAVLLIFVIWFKLACSIDATRFIPSRAEVERFRDEYETIKGHRDFVVIYCLRGDESQEDTLASIRAAINSKFPTHRLRILLLFYGGSCSVLDRFLRTHLSAEPLDPSLDDAPIENLIAINSVKISVLRISMTSSRKANLRCLEFLSMAYAEDKLRKPIVCFLSPKIILDEMAVARFVYELDDPRREFITGTMLKPDNLYFLDRLFCSVPFGFWIETRTAEDYCGNTTQMPGEFLVARFKALHAASSQACIECNCSESMQNHQLTMSLIKAKSTRHRLGICLGAVARPASNPAQRSVALQIKELAKVLMERFIQNAEIILETHILSTSPLLSLLTIGISILEPLIYFFLQLFLLEYICGRGNALASSYIFLLLLPSYLFTTFIAYKNGDKATIITIVTNFLLKPLVDIVADITICSIFAHTYIWGQLTKKYSTDAKDTSQLTSVQRIV